jgi:hypothetical protein
MFSGPVRTFALVALTMVAPALFGAAVERPQVDAQILERGQYKCSGCFLGPTDTYFCLKADNKILIGHQKVPTMTWQDADKNYAAKYHKAWTPSDANGSLKIRYDEKYIWLPNPGGKKDIRLTQDYNKDIFISEPQCRGAVKRVIPQVPTN